MSQLWVVERREKTERKWKPLLLWVVERRSAAHFLLKELRRTARTYATGTRYRMMSYRRTE